MLKTLFIILIFLTVGITSKTCDDDDFFYWPDHRDSSKEYVNKVTVYYVKVDSLSKRLHSLEEKIDFTSWRTIYHIYQVYDQLETLSKNNHPDRERYYKKMKNIYVKLAKDVRTFGANERRYKEGSLF